MAADIIGEAILDYQMGDYREKVVILSSLEEQDILPIPYLFRNYEAMPPLEKRALQLCRGKVLDIGCGAGSHSLYLQQKGFSVTALDQSEKAIKTCSMRGIKNTVHSNILNYRGTKFDTLLLLMNGIGIAGQLENLDAFLKHLKTLLKKNGQILLDSSDIIYMYEKEDPDGHSVSPSGNYYGEMSYRMRYKGTESETSQWLYLDYQTLRKAARANNLECELVSNGEHYDYLARLFPET